MDTARLLALAHRLTEVNASTTTALSNVSAKRMEGFEKYGSEVSPGPLATSSIAHDKYLEAVIDCLTETNAVLLELIGLLAESSITDD